MKMQVTVKSATYICTVRPVGETNILDIKRIKGRRQPVLDVKREWAKAYRHKLIEEQVGHVNGLVRVGLYNSDIDFLPDGSKESITIVGFPGIIAVNEVP